MKLGDHYDANYRAYRNELRAQIVDFVRASGKTYSGDVGKHFGIDAGIAKGHMVALERAGRLVSTFDKSASVRSGRGRRIYTLPTKAKQSKGGA